MKRWGLLILLLATFLTACTEAAPTATTATTEPIAGPLPDSAQLALSVTEGGLPNGRAEIFARFADYRAVGVTCVRIDTAWDTSEQGAWKMSETTRNYFEAAREYGLMLKLILPTVMAPPAWLSAADDTRLVDQNGRQSVNTVSYWYKGIADYTDMAVRAQLAAIAVGGWNDVVGAVIIDMGPAGEPLYPPAWTQVADGLDNGGGAEVMWCYADNAQADFRRAMEEKYRTIAAANEAWGTDYEAFSAVTVPKPETVPGALWRDTLEWYYAVKREFMAEQIDVFTAAMADFGLADRTRILYLPGADVTEAQWESCVASGTATDAISIGCDNRFAVGLAAEKGCALQYTGINDRALVWSLRSWMYEAGYGALHVYGENAGDAVSASRIALLAETVMTQKLAGFDYTHARWLYEADGVTKSAKFADFAEAIAELQTYLADLDLSVAPGNSVQSAKAAPQGNVLRLDLHFHKPETETVAYLFLPIGICNWTVEAGDTLEYDVRLSVNMAGLGAIDGNFYGGKTMRDHYQITDTNGLRVHPNADLSDFAYPQWYHRVIELGSSEAVGKRLTDLLLAVHPEHADGAFTDVDATVWYDNIVLKRNGEVVAELFTEGEGFQVRTPTATHCADGTLTIEILK